MNFTTLKFIKNTKTERFIKVHTFETKDAKWILDGINQAVDAKLYFSDTGNIVVIQDGDKPKEKFRFYPQIVIPNDKTDVSTSGDTNVITRRFSDQKYFYSYKTGKWILYIEDDAIPKIVLYYNPLARDAFAQDFLTRDTLDNALDNVAAYCIDSGVVDPACYCVNVENTKMGDESKKYQFCMNDLLGSNDLRSKIRIADRTKYDTDSRLCHCLNMNCLSNHPFRTRFDRDKIIQECPSSLVMTSCNVVMTAKEGGSVTTGATNIQQKCSSQYGGTEIGDKSKSGGAGGGAAGGTAGGAGGGTGGGTGGGAAGGTAGGAAGGTGGGAAGGAAGGTAGGTRTTTSGVTTTKNGGTTEEKPMTVITVETIQKWSWGDWITIGVLIVFVIGFIIFILYKRKQQQKYQQEQYFPPQQQYQSEWSRQQYANQLNRYFQQPVAPQQVAPPPPPQPTFQRFYSQPLEPQMTINPMFNNPLPPVEQIPPPPPFPPQ